MRGALLRAIAKKTNPAGEKLPNQFGLRDIHGNVLEWVEDCWHGNYLAILRRHTVPTNGVYRQPDRYFGYTKTTSRLAPYYHHTKYLYQA
jgi:formylglycine-generating enzyme required for sulfatase activity